MWNDYKALVLALVPFTSRALNNFQGDSLISGDIIFVLTTIVLAYPGIFDCYCIFFNSIVGINSILNELELQDFKVFCSRESTDIQILNGRKNVTFEVGELARFNFFTSSFFSGLDIHSPIKPNIVILTDCGFKAHTLIDPYTDTLQIVGRFRKQFANLHEDDLGPFVVYS